MVPEPAATPATDKTGALDFLVVCRWQYCGEHACGVMAAGSGIRTGLPSYQRPRKLTRQSARLK